MKTSFTDSERYQLIGLQTVQKSLWAQIANVERAAAEITGEDVNNASDTRAAGFVNEERPIERLIELLEIDAKREKAA